MRTIPVVLLASAFAATASAQDASVASYDGTWAMSGSAADGRPINAELVLKGDGGTWRLYASGGVARKGNPCLMKEFPVDVQKRTADALTFHVDGPKVVAGCNEFTATLKPVGANALDGTTEGGGTLHIERK